MLDTIASARRELGDVEGARAGWNRAAELPSTLRVARAAQMRAQAEALPRTRPRPGG